MQQAVIGFEDISFTQTAEGVRGLFLGRYYFDIPREDLEAIAPYTVENGSLLFEADEGYAWKNLARLVEKGLDNLYHINYNKPTVYVTKPIPLVGTNEFGIVDRGSNTIEIKPLTGCNLQCPFCSVDEGKNDKTHDYVVDCDYLVEEAAKVAAIKEHPVEFHIGPQGEPMLYPKFVDLVRGLKTIPNCKTVTVVTNGTLLTKKFIDRLADAGLDKINLSLNALTQEIANEMSGRVYPVERVLEMITYCEGKIKVIVAPTIVPGMNEGEMDGLVQIGKSIEHEYPPVAFQNFLNYKRGRNPERQRSFEEFFKLLQPLEEQHDIRLTGLSSEDFGLHEEKELPKPFKKRDVITATIAMPARYPNEIIATAEDRCITVKGRGAHNLPKGKRVKVQIIRDKHNIFKGVLV